MTVKTLRETIDAIEKAGIKKFTIWCNNAYIIEVNSESTKVIFDDDNARFFYIRIPNGITSRNDIPLTIECEEYELVERICAGGSTPTILSMFNNLGLTPTDELTQWLKTAGSQSGLCPIQSPKTDSNGKTIASNLPYRPSLTTY